MWRLLGYPNSRTVARVAIAGSHGTPKLGVVQAGVKATGTFRNFNPPAEADIASRGFSLFDGGLGESLS